MGNDQLQHGKFPGTWRLDRFGFRSSPERRIRPGHPYSRGCLATQGRQPTPQVQLIDAELARQTLQDLLLLNAGIAAGFAAQTRSFRHDRQQPLDGLVTP